jgi:hypothetical protein
MLWIFLVQGGLQQWHQVLILMSLLCVPFTRGWTVNFRKRFASSSVRFSLHSPPTFRSQTSLGNSTTRFRGACLFEEDGLVPLLPDKGMLRYNIRRLNFSQRYGWRCVPYGILRCVEFCIVIIFWYIIRTSCTSHTVYFIWQLLYIYRASLSPIFRSTKQL